MVTTPGATEAVTPDEYAAEIWSVLDTDSSLNAAVGCLRHEAVIPYLQRCIANIVREAEANALRRAADVADKFNHDMSAGIPIRHQIASAIRSLLPKEEGK